MSHHNFVLLPPMGQVQVPELAAVHFMIPRLANGSVFQRKRKVAPSFTEVLPFLKDL